MLFCLKVPPLLPRVYLAPAAARAGGMHAPSQFSQQSKKSFQKIVLTTERFHRSHGGGGQAPLETV